MSLVLRSSAISARPVARPAARAVAVRPRVVVRAEQSKSAVETAIKEAEDACKDGSTKECAAAWDAVEEVSATAADKKTAAAAADPLETFCEGDPSADECRVYDE